jgi:hypothetical protein
MYLFILRKKRLGIQFGRFIHKLIWPPWVLITLFSRQLLRGRIFFVVGCVAAGKFFKHLFFSNADNDHAYYVLITAMQCSWRPKTLTPGGIQTMELLFCRRTRWPLNRHRKVCITTFRCRRLPLQKQGCQIFLVQYTKTGKNISNGHKIDLMSIKYTNIFYCKTVQNLYFKINCFFLRNWIKKNFKAKKPT